MRLRLPVGTKSWIVLVSRAAHGLISLVFLPCIAVIYLAAWRGEAEAVTFAALAALCVEGALVLLSGGNCPLGPILRRSATRRRSSNCSYRRAPPSWRCRSSRPYRCC